MIGKTLKQLGIGLALTGAVIGAVGAQGKPSLAVELNKLEQTAEGQCRVYLLLRNRTGHALTELQLDLVTLDKDGIIAGRLAVDVGPLSAGKFGVRLFDMPSLNCDAIGNMLLNDVLVCKSAKADAGVDPASCLQMIEPASKAGVPLTL